MRIIPQIFFTVGFLILMSCSSRQWEEVKEEKIEFVESLTNERLQILHEDMKNLWENKKEKEIIFGGSDSASRAIPNRFADLNAEEIIMVEGSGLHKPDFITISLVSNKKKSIQLIIKGITNLDRSLMVEPSIELWISDEVDRRTIWKKNQNTNKTAERNAE